MPTFSYQTKTGGTAKIDAPDSASALRALSTRTDANPRSGVMQDVLPKPKDNVLASKTFGGSLPETPVGNALGTGKKVKVTTYGGTAQEKQDKLNAQLLAQAERDAMSSVDEDQIMQDKLRQFQAEIDATNQIYAGMLSEQKEENRGTLGSARAIQARSGFLGSSFGQAEDANVIKQGNEQLNLIRAEQAAKINAILGLARQSAAQEIAQKRQAQKEGLQNYLTYLTTAQERRQSRMSALAQELLDQGIDPAEVDAKDLKRIAREYGFNEEDIVLGYQSEKKAREQAEAEAKALAEEKAFERRIKSRFNLSEGEVMYERDPVTGELQILASRPKTFVTDPATMGPTGQVEFDSTGTYIGSNPALIGRSRAEVNSLTASRSAIYATLQAYTDKNGNNLANKWETGSLTTNDLKSLSDSDAKSIVSSKRQIDEPGKNVVVSSDEAQKELNADGIFGFIGQEYDKAFSGRNFDEKELKDMLDTSLVKSGGALGEEIILTD